MKVADFQIEAPIGRGGMGEVWSGHHTPTGTAVAMKLLKARWAGDEELKAAFRAEVRAIAALDHPHIVQVLDFGEVTPEEAEAGGLNAGIPYLVMEHVTGGTLAKKGGTLNWNQLEPLLHDLLGALGHAHARGVTHRDIKGGNILLAERGAVLTDFGIAHVAARGRRKSELVGEVSSGTPSYMAPEQFRGDPRLFGPWTDLYALGAVIWWMCCGHKPFRTTSWVSAARAHTTQPLPEFAPAVPVPAGTLGWLRMCLAKHPRDRFQRAADAAAALKMLGPGWLPPVGRNLADAEAPTVIHAPRGEVHLLEAQDAEAPPAPLATDWRTRVDAPTPNVAGLGLFGLRALPFVARDAAREQLWNALRKVHGGGVHRAITLVGTAGSGKSRLAEWFGERSHELGAAVPLHVVHSEDGGAADGLGPMIARHFRLTPGKQASQLEEELLALGAEESWEWEVLGRMLDPDTPSPKAPDKNAALRNLLARIGRRRPVLLWVDDAQWGVASALFCANVLQSKERVPVVIVLTVREEALDSRPVERAVISGLDAPSIGLGPLPERDITRLVSRMLHAAPSLRDRIAERAAGNPLFAVQLLEDWVQRGLVADTGQGYALREGVPVPLPDSLSRLWNIRIARLLQDGPSEHRTALELAALMGNSPRTDEWNAAVQASGSQPVPELVEQLLARRLARPHAEGVEIGFSFVHGLLRDAIVEGIEDPTPLHRSIAAALPGPHNAGRRGRHLHAAAAWDEAEVALLEGAKVATTESRWDDVHHLVALREEALMALEAQDSDSRFGDNWALLADAENYRGNPEESEAIASRLMAAAKFHGWAAQEAQAANLLGNRRILSWDYAGATGYFRRARALAEGLDEPEIHFRALRGTAWCAMSTGRYEQTLAAVEDARAAYEATGDTVGLGSMLVIASTALGQNRKWAEAEATLREALPYYIAAGARLGRCAVVCTLADMVLRQGRYPEAETLYREALAIARQVQSNVERAILLGLANLDVYNGHHSRALETIRKVWKQTQETQSRAHVNRVDAYLVLVLAHLGDWVEFDEVLDRMDSARDLHPSPDSAQCLTEAAQVAAARGHPGRAERSWALGLDQWTRLGATEVAEELRATGISGGTIPIAPAH